MEAVRIPISICPHFSQGKPRGHYVLAKRLFGDDPPILAKQQYVGYNGFLFITVVHPAQYDTIFKMICGIREMDDRPIDWLGTTHLYPMTRGFKAYLPGHILKVDTPEKVEGVGIFRKYTALGFELYYLELPMITAEVMVGRKKVK